MLLAAAAAAAVVVLPGCSSTPHRDAVVSAARSFVASVTAGDGARACAMLTDDARSSASGATDASCADAVTGVKEHGTGVSGVQVWGDAAQVRIGGDVLFLRLVSGGWRVNAAGCTPQPQGPYDCKVGG
jgi:outer membrane murein-binding lipoprotein Lpp